MSACNILFSLILFWTLLLTLIVGFGKGDCSMYPSDFSCPSLKQFSIWVGSQPSFFKSSDEASHNSGWNRRNFFQISLWNDPNSEKVFLLSTFLPSYNTPFQVECLRKLYEYNLTRILVASFLVMIWSSSKKHLANIRNQKNMYEWK